MTTVPLGHGAYSRTYAQEPQIELLNRFFEHNPTNQVEQTALLARPGNTLFLNIGIGPIRLITHQPGAFNNDLFIVSGVEVFRYDGVITPTLIGTVDAVGRVEATFVTGAGFEHIFISDTVSLQFYDGVLPTLNTIVTPDNVGISSLANLVGFAITVVTKSQRFFWIRPGAVTIDALDFATAESEPDEIIQVLAVGDLLWFLGQTSVEPWYATGDLDITASQFAPQKGLAFNQGILRGSAAVVRTQIFVVGEDGKVYKLIGGPRRVSNNGIDEKIRFATEALTGG